MGPFGIVEVDLAALARNYATLARAAAPGALGAVVKANAYGLGVGPVARRLLGAGCRHFFVATTREGLELRPSVGDADVFVLGGLGDALPAEFRAARLTPVLNSLRELALWGATGPAAVHVDTGMNRLGLARADIDALGREKSAAAAVDVRWVMTHLACADEPERALNAEQMQAFDELRSLWPEARTSVGNSAGALLGEGFRSDVARPGIALYGANPFRQGRPPVEPVITVKGRILQLRQVEAGASIGYGASFVAPGPMRVAVVGVGYADGYLRSLSNCGIASVAGVRVPVVGRVSMDLTCLDVTAVAPEALHEGDWATLIGGPVPLEEIAALAGTINYEMLTALGARLERIYLDGDQGREERH